VVHHSSRYDLRVVENLLKVIYGTAPYTFGLQRFEPKC